MSARVVMRQFALLALTGGLVACQVPSPATGGAPSVASEPTAIAPAKAELALTIQWPDRRIQLLPLSTDFIRITVGNASVASTSMDVQRPNETSGALGSSKAVFSLTAASGLSVIVQALRTESNGSQTTLASGHSVVNLYPNQRTPLTLTLEPSNTLIPVLNSLSTGVGAPGTHVIFNGDGTRPFIDTPYLAAMFGDVRTSATRIDGTHLEAIVPMGAQNGKVKVLTDGVSSGELDFSVVSTMSITPASGLAATSPVASRSVRFSLANVKDTDGNSVIIQPEAWEIWTPGTLSNLTPDAVGTSSVGVISAQGDGSGIFTVRTTGTAWIRARFGSLAATAAITVQ